MNSSSPNWSSSVLLKTPQAAKPLQKDQIKSHRLTISSSHWYFWPYLNFISRWRWVNPHMDGYLIRLGNNVALETKVRFQGSLSIFRKLGWTTTVRGIWTDQSDRRREYLLNDFLHPFKFQRVGHELTDPCSPHTNFVAKHMNCTSLCLTIAMPQNKQADNAFVVEEILFLTYSRNCEINHSPPIIKTIYHLLNGQSLNCWALLSPRIRLLIHSTGQSCAKLESKSQPALTMEYTD